MVRVTNGFAPEEQPVEGGVLMLSAYDGDDIHLGIDPATVSGHSGKALL
jgi:hypothetical protein